MYPADPRIPCQDIRGRVANDQRIAQAIRLRVPGVVVVESQDRLALGIGEHRTETTLTTIWGRDEGVQDEVGRLVEAERECCAFLSVELTIGDDSVTLVTAFPEGLSPNDWEW